MNNRQEWLSVLAKADSAQLEQLWANCDLDIQWQPIRAVESGLIQLQGRMGGTGNRFNLGDMTVSRAAVKINGGYEGFGYVAGLNRLHCERMALLDAMMQSPEYRDVLQQRVIAPLAATAEENRKIRAEKIAATKVDFFTVVRGED